MKKYFILILFVIVILVGEIASSPKTITGQRDGMNVWKVNHFFDLYNTEYLTPVNDTTKVVIVDKKKVNNKYFVNVSDGNSVILLKTKEIYDAVEQNDTVTLVKTYEPIRKHKYRIKYKIVE